MSEEQGIDIVSPLETVSILSLSDEILLMIINFLRTEDKFKLSKVCRRFDRLLLEKKLCRNIEMSSKQDGSCLKYIGFYLRRRRHLIHSVNITNCDWIPMPKIALLTKGLSNLDSLHVMNISLTVLMLSKILKESKQLRELSWSWRGDAKSKDITWSDLPPDERDSLSSLERLHICLPDPSACAVKEFLLVFCEGLTHLTIQVDQGLGKLPKARGLRIGHSCGPKKLKSLVAYHVSYNNYIDQNTIQYSEFKLQSLINDIWFSAGGFQCAWECLWTNSYSKMPWSKAMESTSMCIMNSSQLKSLVISSNGIVNIGNGLLVKNLVITYPFSEEGYNLPSLHSIAPKLETLAIIVKKPTSELSSWVTSAIHTSDHLVEINLLGIHYCRDVNSLENFWLAVKSLYTLRKLAAPPCILPRSAPSLYRDFSKEKFIISKETEISKDLSESLRLDFLEEFEVGQLCSTGEFGFPDQEVCQLNWIPYIPFISIWTSLTCLTIDSIASLRTLCQFSMVAKACVKLSSLRFRCIGPRGHCGYVKDVARALPYCCALRYFRLDQPYISDFLKDLLIGLSECSLLEGICITNCNSEENSHLRTGKILDEIILKLINKCPFLHFLQVPLPNATKTTCNKLKNWIKPKLTPAKAVPVLMEFCSRLTIPESTFHAFPPDFVRIEQMLWHSKVALTPPVI